MHYIGIVYTLHFEFITHIKSNCACQIRCKRKLFRTNLWVNWINARWKCSLVTVWILLYIINLPDMFARKWIDYIIWKWIYLRQWTLYRIIYRYHIRIKLQLQVPASCIISIHFIIITFTYNWIWLLHKSNNSNNII